MRTSDSKAGQPEMPLKKPTSDSAAGLAERRTAALMPVIRKHEAQPGSHPADRATVFQALF